MNDDNNLAAGVDDDFDSAFWPTVILVAGCVLAITVAVIFPKWTAAVALGVIAWSIR